MENEKRPKQDGGLSSRSLIGSTARLDSEALCECGQPRRAHSPEPPHGCEISGCKGFYRFISSSLE